MAKGAEPGAEPRALADRTPGSRSGRGSAAAAGQPAEPDAAFRLRTLKRRREFLHVRKGERAPTPAFVLEGKARRHCPAPCSLEARFGFTVTRQIGNAVVRNRIRRRLKAAVAGAAGAHARRDFDYVLIARRAALARPFSALVADLVRALERIDRAAGQARHNETRNTLAG